MSIKKSKSIRISRIKSIVRRTLLSFREISKSWCPWSSRKSANWRNKIWWSSRCTSAGSRTNRKCSWRARRSRATWSNRLSLSCGTTLSSASKSKTIRSFERWTVWRGLWLTTSTTTSTSRNRVRSSSKTSLQAGLLCLWKMHRSR